MITLNNLLNISYNKLVSNINEYNKNNNTNIRIVICKINDNKKFIKYIHSKNYYYVYLETKDTEICEKLDNILKNNINENTQRHLTNKYLLEEVLNNNNLCNNIFVSHIFTK